MQSSGTDPLESAGARCGDPDPTIAVARFTADHGSRAALVELGQPAIAARFVVCVQIEHVDDRRVGSLFASDAKQVAARGSIDAEQDFRGGA